MNTELLSQARTAILQNDKATARVLLRKAILKSPRDAQAWLLLAQAVEERAQVIDCLNRVLSIDPENQAARKALAVLKPAMEMDPHLRKSSQPFQPIPQVAPVEQIVFSQQPQVPLKRHRILINWPLVLGILLVGILLLIAIKGPAWAPQDPMQQNYNLMVDGKIRTPPYPPFKIPGYPLGTDGNGRDLWSRILWAVRPTLIMISVVAAVRLGVGILLGLIIGWAEGRRGRTLDSLLSSILSIPVLIVALIGVYAVGVERGLLAFIIGLGLTGWAETARMISEQTRLIKKQVFIEASRALGASDSHILFVHVLRQIISLVWMLLAFEVSATLLISAELGFLGYYIGGGVWIEVSDFHVVNVQGLPELGQMLSTALVKLTDPSALIVVGTVIFMGVLGFNLLGEGLRQKLSQQRLSGRRFFALLPAQWDDWLRERVFLPLSFWWRTYHRLVWGAILIPAVVGGGWFIYKSVFFKPLENQGSVLEVPGDHLWATQRHDPQGTLWTPVSLKSPPEFEWNISIPGGPSGGPAVNADGIIYIASLEKILSAVSPEGQILWQAPLSETPVGSPALDADGQIYIADDFGGISAFDPDGNFLWRGLASEVRSATSGPVIGTQGLIYVTVIDSIAALSLDGQLVWRATAADVYLDEPPRLSPGQELVYLRNTALQANSGIKQEIQIAPPESLFFADPAYFTGADGKNYYRMGHEVIGWRLTSSGLESDAPLTWKYDSVAVLLPTDQGVTPDGLAWLYYATVWYDTRMVWLDGQSRVVGNFRLPNPNAKLIAVGQEDEAYICGAIGLRIECVKAEVGLNEPAWKFDIEVDSEVVGGALVPGRLYVAVGEDGLYAFGSQE
jgi:peptide/nickel transport system permease protein